MHDMNDMLHTLKKKIKKKKKHTHTHTQTHKFIYECILFLVKKKKKNLDLCCKKIEFGLEKSNLFLRT